MKYLLTACFLFILGSCQNKPQPKKLYSSDFMDTAQKNFYNQSMKFYQLQDSAANEIGKNLLKDEQQRWMRNYFDSTKSLKNWVGLFHLKATSSAAAAFEIGDYGKARFVTKGICTPTDTFLYHKLATIPDSTFVKFSAKSLGVSDFDFDIYSSSILGIPDVVIILDSIEKLPVNY